MSPSRQVLSTLAAAAAVAFTSVDAAMGPAFSTGPVGSGSWIREATATLVLPNAPSGSSGDASLWVGMGTSNGDLIQSIADNWESSEWSIFAYTLVKTGDNSQMPVQSDATPASASDEITMHYIFDDASGNYTQLVSINGEQVATLSTSSGQAQGWGSAVECAEENCGTVAAHSWINTRIILDSADPNYDQTLGKAEGVTGEMTTSDGGITWDIGTIEIPEFSFSG
ncbi:hypothetical protein UCREL1_5709 [Eutypa lata UCREL1]|uniref:Uncharacterized protein n=1 Tax=Eutypa lata (strain UCR-EL1) TaxID=1287681 RepID=M7TKP6_EUTLA|nr:hypothetical protein UCREL1_5709 [Eutypa lata UCREL1]